MEEVQLTDGNYGHMINSIQVFSPDDQWVVYDTRNDQTHIGRTCCVEKVNVRSGEIVRLYSAPGQSLHGPGVGAVAYHPKNERMIFIHGLMNCDESNPYGFTRRFGAILGENPGGTIQHAEARVVDTPFVEGALRGGTHAYSWSGDGDWISFTYNDFLMEQREAKGLGASRDLRTIGVMSPDRKVVVDNETPENFSGNYFSVVAATVTENPTPGGDQIEKAFDECWIGTNGYIRKDGVRQRRALAFQGNVRTENDSLLTEVFVADIPDDVTRSAPGELLAGTISTRPNVPRGLQQRRVTFTADRKFPGLQGPRFWLRSSPDGAHVYFLMKDDDEVVQIFEVPVLGGGIRQVTRLGSSVQAQFNVSPNGRTLALIADNSIWIVDIESGESTRCTPKRPDADAPVLAVVWNNEGNSLVYNRYIGSGAERYLQIFRIDMN